MAIGQIRRENGCVHSAKFQGCISLYSLRVISGEARRKWMVVPITDLQTLKIYPKRQLDNCHFDRNGKVLLLENDHKMVVTEKWIGYIF